MPYMRAVPTDVEALHQLGFEAVEEEGPSGELWIVPKKKVKMSLQTQARLFSETSDGVVHFLPPVPRKKEKDRTEKDERKEADDLRFRMFVLAYGTVNPEFYSVEASCGNLRCVSTDHAVVVKKKKRSGRSALSDQQVEEIRMSTETVRALARRLGVNPGVVSAARNGRTYRHVNKTAVVGRREDV